MDLFAQSLQSLEWPSFLAHYSEYCQSTPAKEEALRVSPGENVQESEALLYLSSEAVTLLKEASFAQLSDLNDLGAGLRRLEKGLVLDGKELYGIYTLLRVSREVRGLIRGRHPKAGEECPGLSNTILSIEDFSALEPSLLHCIEPDGSVKDSASPRLRGLKDQERKLHSEARERLDAVLQRAFRDGHLQDRYFDFRDGRYLIPVKTEHKNQISGLVVESSTTKATVFMEPAAVRECNDRLKQVQLDIEEEIYIILSKLSAQLAPHALAMKFAFDILIRLDLTLARGRIANYYESVRGAALPVFSESIELEGLYHPLLSFVIPSDKIIRSDLLLQRKIMVISGPNTGGKTVLLKALGLCALMARAGFYLPCAGQARLPFFRKVLAQIGDAQNLELSLSSFSGSVLGLKNILESGGESSLVLIDEILHATDPDEATALARSILEELESRGAYALVTTHLNGLKVSQSADFLSASMEFDEAELKPTYRLRLGIPGSSRALEIGEKLGLSKSLVARARGYLQKGHVQLQDLVDKLVTQEKSLSAEREDTVQLRLQLETQSAQNEKLREQLENQRRTMKETLQQEMRDLERETTQMLEATVAEFKAKITDIGEKHAATVESKKRIQEIRARVAATQQKLEIEQKAAPEAPSPLKQNTSVFIRSMRAQGTLLSDPKDQSKPAEVLLGKMKMRVDWKQLSPREEAKSFAKSITIRSESVDCPPELNIIGRNSDEAEMQVRLYLDKASRSGRPSVRIVHGMGSGTLRRMVREVLKSLPYELKFRPGQQNEGAEGCTVVEFS